MEDILLAVGMCCCLQTCNSVVKMVVIGLVLGPSLIVISITGVLLYAKVSPLYMYYRSALLLFTGKQHVLAHLVIGPYLCINYQTYTFNM